MRILFIVNDHPNEGFAISVAMQAAKSLRAAGHNVIWHKVPAEETLLGRALKGIPGKNGKYSYKEADKINRLRLFTRAGSLIRGTQPDFAYSFHCTRADSRIWQGKNASFLIENIDDKTINAKISLGVFEIKAHYKKIPEKALKKVMENVDYSVKGNAEIMRYLTRTTSMEETKKAGLLPGAIGAKIADCINAEVRRQSQKQKNNVRIRRTVRRCMVKKRLPNQRRMPGMR